MTTILSSPTTVTVAVAETSALSTLAATMTPGTWAQVVVATQNAVLSDIGVTGSMLPYCNSMPWNPRSRTIEIVASDHVGATANMHHVRYDAATSQFILAQAAAVVPGIGHGYDHNTVNPKTGDLYHRQYGNSITVYRKAIGAASFTSIPSGPGQTVITTGTAWWSGPFTGGTGAGADGCLVVFSGYASGTANDGWMMAYDPLSNSWFYSQQGAFPFTSGGANYSQVLEYSSVKNVAIYGGTNDYPRKIFRLNSNGTFTQLQDAPYGFGIDRANVVADSVTGNFLFVFPNGQLWELNPSGSGTWTQQTGSRVPPSAVYTKSFDQGWGLTSCAIADHGVVAYIKQPGTAGGSMWVYKHA